MKAADAPSSVENPVVVTVQIPSAVAPLLGDNPAKITRRLLEQAALEGYCSNHLSRGNVSALLGLTWTETEEFLAQHDCPRHYDLEDLEKDRRNLDEFFGPA